ncbi:nucleoside phosphorylase domain-containing protein [Xylogone sp. PMI_703]|nr:nucleoside phosphorylase domain-containing protein [Xylogone sp. PMI_703]
MKHEDYLLGWICALPLELSAAESMLDEQHQDLPIRQFDQNIYSLGSIGVHNVVIACLPAGVTGTTSAAKVATDMIRNFTKLRSVLMIGIGGGVPSEKHDIRLGDVVVGMPTGEYGGVIQFDFGRATADGTFSRVGVLSKPPGVLLSTLASLRARHEREHPQLIKYISDAMPRTSRFAYPGMQNDSLYEANYDHKSGERTCSRCDSSRLILREARSFEHPKIHYGLIASGNRVTKSGAMREKFKDQGVLCTEMEAAGLMDTLTAAAYAKELVNALPTAIVRSSITAADALDLDVDGREPLQVGSQDSESETSSQSSMTLINDSELNLISTAAEEVAHILASDQRLKPLYTSGVLRMAAPVFRRNLMEVLISFGKEIREREHLQRFINDRFPISQQKPSKGNQEADLDYEIQESAEVGEDDDAPPELRTLTDVHDLRPILCMGEAYWESYRRMKSIIFPSPSQQLERALGRYLPKDGGPQTVNCLIEWELLQYMDSESVKVTELDSIFTLTGNLDCAYAARLGDYMSQKWTTGDTMVAAIKELISPFVNRSRQVDQDMQLEITRYLGSEHQFQIRLQPKENEKEQAMVQV